ncbi:MAG: hypothetical protein LV481_13045 [Methylacidiphilales bacterium]|nr:hypothetical protein [Candidatus Methylacidiphilales bacterium]
MLMPVGRSDFLGFDKKIGEIVEGRFRHPTFGALATFAGADEARAGQFFQMMRDRGLADFQTPAQFSHAKPGTFLRIAAMPLAAMGEAQENSQTVGMREGLERIGGFFNIH